MYVKANLGNDTFEDLDGAVENQDTTTERRVVSDVYENSPYPEVGIPSK